MTCTDDLGWMMMMSFICSCRNTIGTDLHVYLEEGTHQKRLFRGGGWEWGGESSH